MPRTTASAYFCRPVGLVIGAESAGFFMFPSSTRMDGNCARLSPAMSARGFRPPVADVVGRAGARRRKLVAHDPRELHGGTGLGVVERWRRIEDVETAARRWAAVGVNADDRVGAEGIGHRGAFIDAGSQPGVVAARHRRPHPQCRQRRPGCAAWCPRRRCARDSRRWSGPLAWQSLVPPRPVGTWRLIDASLAPLWPGSRNTIIPAMLAGAAVAGQRWDWRRR